MLGITTILALLVFAHALPSAVDLTNIQQEGFVRFNTERRIAKDGYFSESHEVVTEDGYILEMIRIPNRRFRFWPIAPGSKPVVFLMHGLQCSGMSYISSGPRLGLAYILADAGYDVWVGNARGVLNSRRHVTLNPDNEDDRVQFFDYTFEDIALKDLPTMIDHVLRVTRKQQLNYIGHSQGGTAFLVLNSVLPQYNKKFISVHLLAAVGYQDYFPNAILTTAADHTDLIFKFAVETGFVELLGPNPNNAVLENSADDENPEPYLLKSAIQEMRRLLGAMEMLAGASIKQYGHYGQNIRDKTFRRWNYNPIRNLLTYGRFTPPSYDLSLINVDLTMHYSLNDVLLDERDVLNMAKVIPNAKVRRVARDTFTHTDFIIAADSRDLVADYIVEKLGEKNK